jgi:hypothetical protein
MSSAAWVARVVLLGSKAPSAVHSSGIEVVEGDLSVLPGTDIEELQTPGVDLQRHRERRRVFKNLVLRLTEDFSSPVLMLAREGEYQRAEARLCRLTARVGDAAKEWDRSTVLMVRIVARHGMLVGFGAATSSMHTLISEWHFRHNRDGSVRA